MMYIRAYLEDADANDELHESRVQGTFLNNIRILAYDVEDIVEKYFPQITSNTSRGFWVSLKTAASNLLQGYTVHNFVTEIEGIRRRIENIPRIRKTYEINRSSVGGGGRDIWNARRSFLHVDEPIIVGFEEHIKRLKARLLDPDLQDGIVSIVGMPGSGRTTLAKRVYDSVQHHFECSAKVYVSQRPTIQQLLEDVAKQLGLKKEKRDDNLEANLSSFLRQRRFLILLDDVWNFQSWNDLRFCFPVYCGRGSRVIVTSRNREVGLYVGGDSSLEELGILDPTNSWKLFSILVMTPMKINKETRNFQKFESLGRQILKKCGGVPLAIQMMAGLLSTKEKTEHSWKRILESMGQDEVMCSKVLALSYKDLPVELKPCFLYFGIFPEDYEISVFELINLWVAEGFIQARGDRLLEDVAEDYINLLIDRNLVHVVERRSNGSIRTCRIHDLLHSLCIRMARDSYFFNTHTELTAKDSTLIRRITMHCGNLGDFISLNYQTPKLRAMLCFGEDWEVFSGKVFKKFPGDFNFLKVLRLECKGLPTFPNEICYLSHLTYLRLGTQYADFGGWILGVPIHRRRRKSSALKIFLPSTMNNLIHLKNLLTLDIRGLHYMLIPSIIWKMNHLRHILLPIRNLHPIRSSEIDTSTMYDIEDSMPNLQSLSADGQSLKASWLDKFIALRRLCVANATKSIIEVLSDATPVSFKLEYLQLRGFPQEACRVLNFSQYKNLYELYLQGPLSKMPDNDQLPPNLSELTLEDTQLEEDPMETLKKLPKLKILKLGSDSYTGDIIVCSERPDDFPELEELELEDLFRLRDLVVEEGGMPRLKKVTITWCSELKIPDRFTAILAKKG